MRYLVIDAAEPVLDPRRKRRAARHKKSTAFSAILLTYLTADRLWSGGEAGTDTIRPIYLTAAGSADELRAFVANMRVGKRLAWREEGGYASARSTSARFELLRSGSYRYLAQKITWDSGQTAVVVTAYLPELLTFDPGLVDSATVTFCLLAPRWWVTAQREQLGRDPEGEQRLLAHARTCELLEDRTEQELLDLAPLAMYFLAALDRRTRHPLLDSLPFAVQCYLHALEQRLAQLTAPDHERARSAREQRLLSGWGFERWFPAPLACHISQAELDAFLEREARVYSLAQQRVAPPLRVPERLPVRGPALYPVLAELVAAPAPIGEAVAEGVREEAPGAAAEPTAGEPVPHAARVVSRTPFSLWEQAPPVTQPAPVTAAALTPDPAPPLSPAQMQEVPLWGELVPAELLPVAPLVKKGKKRYA